MTDGVSLLSSGTDNFQEDAWKRGWRWERSSWGVNLANGFERWSFFVSLGWVVRASTVSLYSNNNTLPFTFLFASI